MAKNSINYNILLLGGVAIAGLYVFDRSSQRKAQIPFSSAAPVQYLSGVTDSFIPDPKQSTIKLDIRQTGKTDRTDIRQNEKTERSNIRWTELSNTLAGIAQASKDKTEFRWGSIKGVTEARQTGKTDRAETRTDRVISRQESRTARQAKRQETKQQIIKAYTERPRLINLIRSK